MVPFPTPHGNCVTVTDNPRTLYPFEPDTIAARVGFVFVKPSKFWR